MRASARPGTAPESSSKPRYRPQPRTPRRGLSDPPRPSKRPSMPPGPDPQRHKPPRAVPTPPRRRRTERLVSAAPRRAAYDFMSIDKWCAGSWAGPQRADSFFLGRVGWGVHVPGRCQCGATAGVAWGHSAGRLGERWRMRYTGGAGGIDNSAQLHVCQPQRLAFACAVPSLSPATPCLSAVPWGSVSGFGSHTKMRPQHPFPPPPRFSPLPIPTPQVPW